MELMTQSLIKFCNKEWKVFEKVDIYVTGDNAWLVVILGMEDMSPHWCVHCKLQPKDWKVHGHQLGEPRTIQFNCDMAKSNVREGPLRKGVKTTPYWDFIPISNYVVPILHNMIGIGNDILKYYESTVDAKFVPISKPEEKLRLEYAAQDSVIKETSDTVKEWDASEKGKQRTSLMARKKQNRELTQEELLKLEDLQMERKLLADASKKAKDRKTAIKTKLEIFVNQRKLEKDSFYAKHEELYIRSGVKRAAYHGGAMTGGHIIKIMKNSEKIFTESRDILKKMKRDGDAEEAAIMDAEIDLLCERTASLLQAWDAVFSLMRVHSPSSAQKDEAKERIENAMRIHRECGLSITPKVHTMEDHAWRQFLSFTHGLALLIEDFVEKNHQDQYKIENQTKRIKNKQLRANRASKIERVAANHQVQAKVHEVKKKRSRPSQKKIKKEECKPTLIHSPTMAKKQKLDGGSSDIQEGPKNVTPPSHHHESLRSIEQEITSTDSPPVSMEFQEGTV
jgi:hypothetical protein